MADKTLYKLGALKGDDWAAIDRGDVYEEESKLARLAVASRNSGSHPLRFLAEQLKGPFGILYLLHTPRTEAEPGRYQSPELERAELDEFLATYHDFFTRDSRHDIWLFDFATKATLVWDRHDIIYAYGPIEEYKNRLHAAGFEPGKILIPTPHQHNYHESFDASEKKVLKAFDWTVTPLKPEDEQ